MREEHSRAGITRCFDVTDALGTANGVGNLVPTVAQIVGEDVLDKKGMRGCMQREPEP